MAAGGQVEVGAAELHDAPEDVVDVERRWRQRAGDALHRLGSQRDAQRCLLLGCLLMGFVHRTSSFRCDRAG